MSNDPAPYDSRPDTLRHIGQVQALLERVAAELRLRGQEHDRSKLHPPELEWLNAHPPGTVIRGSDADAGLRHHYAHNRHHPEYHPGGIADMTLMDLTELLCDWIAASTRSPGTSVREYISGPGRARFGYEQELERLLLNTLTTLENTFPDS